MMRLSGQFFFGIHHLKFISQGFGGYKVKGREILVATIWTESRALWLDSSNAKSSIFCANFWWRWHTHTHTHTDAHLYKNSCANICVYIYMYINVQFATGFCLGIFSICSTSRRSEPLAVAGRASDCPTGCAHQHVARTATNHQGGWWNEVRET